MTFSGQNPDKFGQVTCRDVFQANSHPVNAASTAVLLAIAAIRTTSGQIRTRPPMQEFWGKTHKSLASRQLRESAGPGTSQIQTLPDNHETEVGD